MNDECTQIISLVQRFIGGTIEPYEWDDFISIPQKDPELEELRMVCVNLPKSFPSSDRRQYCNQEGIERLEEVVRRLERARR